MAQFLLFFCPNQAPSACCQIASPCHLKPNVPHLIRAPPKNQPTHTFLAKTELLWLGFCIFCHNQAPFAHCQITSLCHKPNVPHPIMVPSTQNQLTHTCQPKPSPCGLVLHHEHLILVPTASPPPPPPPIPCKMHLHIH